MPNRRRSGRSDRQRRSDPQGEGRSDGGVSCAWP
jgi:hypothetical protein